MQTVLRIGPYRFYFYSHEPNEPPHIHVDRDDMTAKYWLDRESCEEYWIHAKGIAVSEKIGA
jgi:Domain of unknown function (DUF4160)